MKKRSESIMVVDHGLYVHIAQLLSRYFKDVYYYCPWERSFPSSDLLLVGDGFEGIHRVKDFWEWQPKMDVFVFPDLYFPGLQQLLRDADCKVWGCGGAEVLETERDFCRELMGKWGMPMAQWWRIEGTKELREFLKKKDDVYVKGLMRGDFETFHHETYDLTEPMLDELEHKLGGKKAAEVFIVEEPIDGNDKSPVVEVGYDGWFCGDWPEIAALGYEIKDCGNIQAFMPYKDIGKPVRYVNTYLERFLKKEGCCGFFSNEIRVRMEAGTPMPYLIDPCCRCGSPASEGYAEAYDNWDEIILEGSQGKLVKPELFYDYVCILVMYSDWAKDNWLAVHCPPEFEENLKLHYACKMDGVLYTAPIQPGIAQIGAVVGGGDSLEEAVQNAVAISKEIKGVEVQFRYGAIDDALKEIKKGEGMGIEFGKADVPEHIPL